nr:cytochrome c [Paracoccus luteus]
MVRRLFLPACLLVAAVACVAVWAAWSYRSSTQIRHGARLYAEHCAACHGARLQGQPDWQVADDSGIFPAPPHDENGHTWHHDDAMLTDYIRRGGQAVLDDMGVSMTSGMPSFGGILTDGDIAAILAFIKSTWPDRIRAIQTERNGG